jgi:hypothetical protein
MAKRTRGSHRPGQRAPLQRTTRPATRPAPPAERAEPATRPVRPATGLTSDEEARAAEIEATLVAEERSAEETARKARERSRAASLGSVREAAPLSVRAAEEYAYVRRDVVRIARIGGSLLLVLAVLHVLINVLRVIPL